MEISKIEINTIYNKDCLDILRGMKNNSVDFCFSDPPYNKNKDYEIYKDNLPNHEYWNWVEQWVSEYKRISGNKIALFIGSSLIRRYWELLPDAYLVIIRKGAIGTPFKTYYRQYFGLLTTVKPKFQIYDLWTDIRMPGEGYYFREERFPNPGLTSLKLIQRVLNYYTNKGDLVFDGFMGVGTTAIACLSLDRSYVGCEINPRYIEITNERIKEFEKSPELFQCEQMELA